MATGNNDDDGNGNVDDSDYGNSNANTNRRLRFDVKLGRESDTKLALFRRFLRHAIDERPYNLLGLGIDDLSKLLSRPLHLHGKLLFRPSYPQGELFSRPPYPHGKLLSRPSYPHSELSSRPPSLTVNFSPDLFIFTVNFSSGLLTLTPVRNKVISGFQATHQARASVARLELATEGYLHVSRRTRKQLCHRRVIVFSSKY
ncbi:hypothetical protein PoB_006018300 [Plakobranchus ocellatus]|uniref:Uncharacterized protein n=1 Tax=Plakobranchus ocellatus TaxID=259542 RepID=A0AAV4CP93_9GAST|nr:hypothetical protein PoB_006018300 [Plakobranchus ocellatus]